MPAREGGAVGQGGGAEVEEVRDRVVEEEGDLTFSLDPGGEGEESRLVMCRPDNQCPLSSIL